MADAQGSPLPPTKSEEIEVTLSAVFREEAGRLVGALLRRLGDFEVAFLHE